MKVAGQARKYLLNINQRPSQECILGVPEKITKEKISVLPNPTDGIISIIFNKCEAYSPITIRIFSMDGRQVFMQKTWVNALEKIELNLSSFPKGIYCLNVSGINIQGVERLMIY